MFPCEMFIYHILRYATFLQTMIGPPFILLLANIQHVRDNRDHDVENEERKRTEVNTRKPKGRILNYVIEGYFNLEDKL